MELAFLPRLVGPIAWIRANTLIRISIIIQQLARIHATMTSIDPGSDVINAAVEHLQKDKVIAERINYRCEPIEYHAVENRSKYDAVVVSEVLEHVIDKPAFLGQCLETLKVHI